MITQEASNKGIEFFDVSCALNSPEKQQIRKEVFSRGQQQPCPPFAIINPNILITKKNGKQMLGRKFNWGFADSFDKENTDFRCLHKLVIRYIREDLIGTINQKFVTFESKKREEQLEAQEQQKAYNTQFGY